MSDLFDRMAMRALGSEANLRSRMRTRFEPAVLPVRGLSIDPAPMLEDTPAVEDDSLADGALTVAHTPRPSFRRGEHRAVGSDNTQSVARPDTSRAEGDSRAKDDAGAPRSIAARRHRSAPESLTTWEDEPVMGAEPPRPRSAPPLTSAAPLDEGRREPGTSRLLASSPPTAAPMAPATIRPASEPTKTRRASDPAPSPASTRPLSASTTLDRASSPGVEAVLEKEADPPSSHAPKPAELGHATDTPARDAAPRFATAERTWRDPLGVEARARIERRSATSDARMSDTTAPAAVAPIEITIGRLEIRADPKPPPRPAKAFAPHVDLATYRSRRERGS